MNIRHIKIKKWPLFVIFCIFYFTVSFTYSAKSPIIQLGKGCSFLFNSIVNESVPIKIKYPELIEAKVSREVQLKPMNGIQAIINNISLLSDKTYSTYYVTVLELLERARRVLSKSNYMIQKKLADRLAPELSISQAFDLVEKHGLIESNHVKWTKELKTYLENSKPSYLKELEIRQRKTLEETTVRGKKLKNIPSQVSNKDISYIELLFYNLNKILLKVEALRVASVVNIEKVKKTLEWAHRELNYIESVFLLGVQENHIKNAQINLKAEGFIGQRPAIYVTLNIENPIVYSYMHSSSSKTSPYKKAALREANLFHLLLERISSHLIYKIPSIVYIEYHEDLIKKTAQYSQQELESIRQTQLKKSESRFVTILGIKNSKYGSPEWFRVLDSKTNTELDIHINYLQTFLISMVEL